MILELRNVASLTEARFAAGEGFTHIRIADELILNRSLVLIEGIKGFLSGIKVGGNAPLTAMAPEIDFDYFTEQINGSAVLMEQEASQPANLYELATNTLLPGVTLSACQAISILSPGEEETGILADYAQIEAQLEQLRAANIID